MAGPSDQYLASFSSALGLLPPQPSGTPTMMLGQQQTQPMLPPPMPVAPPQPAPAPAPQQPPPPMAAQPVAHAQPQHDGPAFGGAPLMANPDVQFRQVGGGSVTPAHEVNVHGAQQTAHMEASFEARKQAATQQAFHSGEIANQEEIVAAEAARAALVRQDAAIAAGQKRSDELKHIEQDYRASVQKLGEHHLDSNRWWANQSTGDKIATGVMAFLGGLGAMGTGGPNLAWQAIQRDMETDIEAQKFDYQTKLDQAKGAQNTYAMAMERYGSEDAATNMARVAALDFVLAKTNEVSAKWKGVEAQNAAIELKAKADEAREQYAAAGWKHVPAAVTAPKFAVSVRGIQLPGAVTADKANAIALEHGVKPAEAVDQELVKGGIAANLKSLEAEGKKAEHSDKKTDEGARYIASKRQEAGLPEVVRALEQAQSALSMSKGGKLEVAGRTAASVIPVVGETVGNMLMGDAANDRERAFALAEAQMLKLLMGNVTNGDETRARRIIAKATDPQSRETTLKNWRALAAEQDKNIHGGATPEAQEQYRRNKAAAKDEPVNPEGAVTSSDPWADQ